MDDMPRAQLIHSQLFAFEILSAPRDNEPSELTVDDSWSYFSGDTESTDAGAPTTNTGSLNIATAIKVPDLDSSGSDEEQGDWEVGS